MKPQFANVFNVSVNDMPEKTVDEVASIMLTRDGAHALTRLLIQSFGMPEDKA